MELLTTSGTMAADTGGQRLIGSNNMHTNIATTAAIYSTNKNCLLPARKKQTKKTLI